MRALHLFRRAALLSRRKRSARRSTCEFPREMTEKILQTVDFHPGGRCAFVMTIAQRATYAL
jgi:hypothetical protein